MAKMIKATPIGLKQFSNREKTRWFYVVYLTFEEQDTDGLACTDVFVSDTDFATIESRFGDPTFTVDIFKSGKFWDYLM